MVDCSDGIVKPLMAEGLLAPARDWTRNFETGPNGYPTELLLGVPLSSTSAPIIPRTD